MTWAGRGPSPEPHPPGQPRAGKVGRRRRPAASKGWVATHRTGERKRELKTRFCRCWAFLHIVALFWTFQGLITSFSGPVESAPRAPMRPPRTRAEEQGLLAQAMQ